MPSVLASSGLLDGGGGGLFDQVDEDLRIREEAERAERERAAKLKAQAEAEAAAAAAATAAQQQQQQQALLQQQQYQQQQQQFQQQQYQQQSQQQQPQYRLDGRMQDLKLQDHNNSKNGFYRPDQQPPPQQQQQQPPVVQQGYGAASYYYSTSGHATTVEQPKPVPTTTAGMHNHPTTESLIPSKPFEPTLKEFSPLYGPIRVSDPLLVQGSGLFSGPPHWTYQVTVTNPQPIQGTEYATTNQVRRRFRHFVALEDRLRVDCPGAILPPRPEKHPTRMMEEATSRQSAQFALGRANELEVYLNALRKHPIAGRSNVLKLFLQLPDHIGTAWPEVSSSLLTRFQEVTATTASKFNEAAAGVMSEMNHDQQMAAGEDSAEMLALASSEGLRIGSVLQAVPKMEGGTILLNDQAEQSSTVGLELSRLIKTVLANNHSDMIPSLEVLSNALMRSGRRSSRLVTELNAALAPFLLQYRYCRYERMAFADRRSALQKRRDIRQKADAHAKKLMMQQRSLQYQGNMSALERMETNAAIYDECAQDANRLADEIAEIVQFEVHRLTIDRRTEWSAGIKIVAANMKEACAERRAIWEGAKETFMTEFPDFQSNSSIHDPSHIGN